MGRRAGCRSLLLDVGHETLWKLSPLRVPERRCRDLYEAAQYVLAQTDHLIAGQPSEPRRAEQARAADFFGSASACAATLR